MRGGAKTGENRAFAGGLQVRHREGIVDLNLLIRLGVIEGRLTIRYDARRCIVHHAAVRGDGLAGPATAMFLDHAISPVGRHGVDDIIEGIVPEALILGVVMHEDGAIILSSELSHASM